MANIIRVLIVDDDPTLIEMYRARMTAEGFVVELAHDGQEALAKAIETNPSIILLDMRMPNVSGLEVLEILRTTKATQKTPIIVLTALGDDQLRKDAMARGATDYMVKAETMPAQVVEKIHALLG
ncbi:MAG: response regulator [Patescibacteria group bacterium]